MLARRVGALKSYADDLALAGFTLAGGKIISSFLLPFASRVFQQSQPQAGAGMSGIAVTTGIPPMIVAPPIQPATNGVNGMAVSSVPGRFGR
jgi:hypothetical protein